MKKNIWFFAQGEANTKSEVLERIGIRGRLAMELADLDLPILPGFVIDADVAAHLKDFDIWAALRPWLDRLAKNLSPLDKTSGVRMEASSLEE